MRYLKKRRNNGLKSDCPTDPIENGILRENRIIHPDRWSHSLNLEGIVDNKCAPILAQKVDYVDDLYRLTA